MTELTEFQRASVKQHLHTSDAIIDLQRIRLLGPFHIAHDTADIANGVVVAAIAANTLVFGVYAMVTEEWAGIGGSEALLGVSLMDSEDTQFQFAAIDLLSAETASGVFGKAAPIATGTSFQAPLASAGTDMLVTVTADVTLDTGEADIYALIAEPAP